MNSGSPLNTTELLAAASKALEEGGYQVIDNERRVNPSGKSVRFFEDPYTVVAVAVYETWADLSAGWPDAQDELVQMFARYLGRGEAKSWDGYLILLTPGVVNSSERHILTEIRHNTLRARKLVSTGEDLVSLADVRRVLMPVLPLPDMVDSVTQTAGLDTLAELLVARGVPESTARMSITAFLDKQPILERLHQSKAKR